MIRYLTPGRARRFGQPAELGSGGGEGSEASGALARGGPIWLATWRGGLRAGPSTGPTLGVGLEPQAGSGRPRGI
jgi:hypothetical protein